MRANAYKRTETYSAYRCRQPDSSFQNKVCSSCETNATLCDALHFKLNSWTPSLLLVLASKARVRHDPQRSPAVTLIKISVDRVPMGSCRKESRTGSETPTREGTTRKAEILASFASFRGCLALPSLSPKPSPLPALPFPAPLKRFFGSLCSASHAVEPRFGALIL